MFQFVSIDLNVFNLHVFFVFAFIDARMLLNSRAKCCTWKTCSVCPLYISV